MCLLASVTRQRELKGKAGMEDDREVARSEVDRGFTAQDGSIYRAQKSSIMRSSENFILQNKVTGSAGGASWPYANQVSYDVSWPP
jgi:hypothetical protein